LLIPWLRVRASSFGVLVRQVLPQRGCDISGTPLDADALCDPHHRRDEKRIVRNVDLLAASKARLHLLGKHRSSAKASNELEPRFTQVLGATLIRHDRAYNVAIPPGDDAASVHIG
jgi:hypothetical protein